MEGVTHTIQYVDTYNNQVVKQATAEDRTQYNVRNNAPSENTLSGVTEGRRVFKGWYFDAEGTRPVTAQNANLLVEKDYTIYALYQDIVTVQYRDDEGVLYEGEDYPNAYQSVNHGGNGTAVEWEPTKAGYTFIGWRESLNSDGVLSDAEILAKLTDMREDAIFYAKFEKNIDISGKKVWVGGQGTEDGEVDLAVYVQNGNELTKLKDQPRIYWSNDLSFNIYNLPYLTQGSYVVREMSDGQPVENGGKPSRLTERAIPFRTRAIPSPTPSPTAS